MGFAVKRDRHFRFAVLSVLYDALDIAIVFSHTLLEMYYTLYIK